MAYTENNPAHKVDPFDRHATLDTTVAGHYDHTAVSPTLYGEQEPNPDAVKVPGPDYVYDGRPRPLPEPDPEPPVDPDPENPEGTGSPEGQGFAATGAHSEGDTPEEVVVNEGDDIMTPEDLPLSVDGVEQPETEAEAQAAEAEGNGDVEGGEYDPSEHKVGEVTTYLDGASEEERERVIAAEREGQGRKTIVEYEGS